MKNLKIIAIVLLSFCFMTKVYSQRSISVHVGPSFPLSDFGLSKMIDEDSEEVITNAGGAAIGLNGGLQYVYTFSKIGLGVFGGVDLNYNGLQKSSRRDFERIFEEDGIDDIKIEYYKYVNVPLTVGLNYIYEGDGMIGVFANAGVALNLLKMTNMKFSSEIEEEALKVKMDLASNLGFKAGAGILFAKKYFVSIDYFGLGKHEIDVEIKEMGLMELIVGFDIERKVDLLTVSLGVKF